MDKIDYDKLNEEEQPFADRLAYYIKQFISPNDVLDIGCGPGTYVYSLRRMNITATGIDTIIGKEHLRKQSILDMTDEKADLVICMEVAEHIDARYEDVIVKKIASAVGRTLIWTAAIPGQGSVGHINCKNKEEWSKKLSAEGLSRNHSRENHLVDFIRQGYHMGWFTQNLLYFERREQ
jgi:SAM-dependent methyltransferase